MTQVRNRGWKLLFVVAVASIASAFQGCSKNSNGTLSLPWSLPW